MIQIFILFDFEVEISEKDETLTVDSGDFLGCEIELDGIEILLVCV